MVNFLFEKDEDYLCVCVSKFVRYRMLVYLCMCCRLCVHMNVPEIN